MRAFCYWLLCLFLLGILACHGENTTQQEASSGSSPLTVEAWKELTPSEKYDGMTLERLRLHDAKLKSERAWRKFMHDVVGPEMRKDMPRPNAK